MDELTIKGPCKAHPSVTSPFSPRSEKGSALNDIRGKAQIELTTGESLYLISFFPLWSEILTGSLVATHVPLHHCVLDLPPHQAMRLKG